MSYGSKMKVYKLRIPDFTNITLNDVYIAMRRQFYLKFRKKYVQAGLLARRGSCAGCSNMGQCCSWNGCKYQDDKSGCLIYGKREQYGYNTCTITPFDEKDIHKRLYGYCKVKYHWVDKRFAKKLYRSSGLSGD